MFIFMGYCWTIKKCLLFYFKRRFKRGPNPESFQIWKACLTLDKCSKYSESCRLLVQHLIVSSKNTASTLAFNIHMFNFHLSSYCCHVMFCSLLSIDLL